MKKIIFILSTCFFLSSCQAPTTVVSRGVNTDIEKERIIMQGIALETFYKRLEKLTIMRGRFSLHQNLFVKVILSTTLA